MHRPSAARPRCLLNPMNVSGVAITVTPPARASVHSPDRRAWAARCSVTSEDEQAVSTVTAGPSSANVYETRPDATLPKPPVPMKPASSSGTDRSRDE
ncbi:hypothetical protein GCM10010434_086720 [Winogradskya humida]